MALEALDDRAPTSAALLAFLRGEGMLYSFGTGVEELAYAAATYGYAQARPVAGWTLDDLRAELAAGRAVVVSLGANGEDQPGHFVTVTGTSADGQWIAYNDPTLGQQVLSWESFEARWAAQGHTGVAFGPGASAVDEPMALPALALLAGAMALVSTSPLARKRQGIGGAIEVDNGSDKAAQPPYPAPAGTRWAVKLVPVTELQEFQDGFKTISVQEPVFGPVQVQVGTQTVLVEQQAYTTIQIDEGYWDTKPVTKYKSETYIAGYTDQVKKVPVPGGWEYITLQVPIFKSKPVAYPASEKVWVPSWVEKQVPAGKYLAEVEEPVYEIQYQVVGYKTVEVEVPNMVKDEVTVGMEVVWELVDDESQSSSGPDSSAYRELPPLPAEYRDYLPSISTLPWEQKDPIIPFGILEIGHRMGFIVSETGNSIVGFDMTKPTIAAGPLKLGLNWEGNVLTTSLGLLREEYSVDNSDAVFYRGQSVTFKLEMAGWDTQTMLAYDAMNYGVTSGEDDPYPNGSGFEGLYIQEKPILVTVVLVGAQQVVGLLVLGGVAFATAVGTLVERGVSLEPALW
jgi:hypothetical protein